MRVSVIVVCYNEEKSIVHCLESLIRSDFPKENYEILCVDNLSTDGTREAVRNLSKDHSQIRMVDNPQRSISASRTVGIRAARFPFVVFTDADCIVSPGWLAGLAGGYERIKRTVPKLAAVGGTNMAPSGRTRFYDASNIVTKTVLGNRGSTQGKEFNGEREVDHMPTLNILYDKEILLKEGGFDEDFRFVCEDPDLNYRLVKAGYRIYYLPRSEVVHAFKPGLLPWAKRIFRYGTGRVQLLSKHPDRLSAVYFVPPLIVLSALCSAFAWVSPVLAWPFIIYGAVIFSYSLFHCAKRRRMDLFFHVLLFYTITHFSFGLGEILGALRRFGRLKSQSGG